MKKSLINKKASFVIIIAFLGVLSAFGQDKWTYQVGAGVNYSLFDNDYHQTDTVLDQTSSLSEFYLAGYYKENTLGFHFNFNLNYHFNNDFFLQSGLFFIQHSEEWCTSEDSILKHTTEVNPPIKVNHTRFDFQVPLIVGFEKKNINVGVGTKMQLSFAESVNYTLLNGDILNYKNGMRWFDNLYYHIHTGYSFNSKPIEIIASFNFKPNTQYNILLLTILYEL